MSKEALEQFTHQLTEAEKQDLLAQAEAAEAQGQTRESVCADYARAKGYDVTDEDFKSLRQPLTEEEMDQISAGYRFPNIRLTQTASADQAACLHNWQYTGRHMEEPLLFFWVRHKKEYRCLHCGLTEWRYDG